MTRRRKPAQDLLHPLAANRARTAKDSRLEAIWQVVASIPRGQVSTYGAVAQAAGFPGRARHAGYALRHAPQDLHLPWHRVVGAGGRISFPRGSGPYAEQVRRLKAEGVRVIAGRVAAGSMTDLAAF